jgi:hypothetical protein
VWLPEASGAPGYEVPFVSIILHAVSRDTTSCPRPCILAHVEGGAPDAAAAAADEEEEEEAEGEASTQLRLVPADDAARACPRYLGFPATASARLSRLRAVPRAVDAIFRAMCDSATLNPDADAGACRA